MMHLSLKNQEHFFDIYINISYFLIIISLFGISFFNKQYITTFDNIIKLYISLFLIWRFHPLNHSFKFGNLDRKIAFSAGIILLTTVFLNNYSLIINNYISSIFNKTIYYFK
jgi:hypothetical protein